MEDVILMGEDVAGGAGTNGEQDAWGGPLGVTKGLLAEFGRERIIDTPITETAMLGMASGAALTGLRPIAELMFIDFMGVCFDQILNQTAKFRYMFGGKAVTPYNNKINVWRRTESCKSTQSMLIPNFHSCSWFKGCYSIMSL